MQQLDGPRFDEVVALEEGQSLKKHFIFVYLGTHFLLSSAHVDASSDRNMRQLLYFYTG
jgi:hypothetical protein